MQGGLKYDVEALKKRLEEAVKGPQRGPSVFKDTRYVAQDGDVVRLFKFADGTIMHDVEYHYNIGEHRVVICPRTFGDKCAICEESIQLWKQAKALPPEKDDERKEIRKAAKSLSTTKRAVVPIKVKNRATDRPSYVIYLDTFKTPKEEEYSDKPNEVRQLMEWMVNPDYGDITDVNTGNDITVKVKNMAKGGFKFQRRTLEVRPSKSPMGTADEIKSAIEALPELSAIIPRTTYSETVEMMHELMSAGSEKEAAASNIEPEQSASDEDMPF